MPATFHEKLTHGLHTTCNHGRRLNLHQEIEYAIRQGGVSLSGHVRRDTTRSARTKHEGTQVHRSPLAYFPAIDRPSLYTIEDTKRESIPHLRNTTHDYLGHRNVEIEVVHLLHVSKVAGVALNLLLGKNFLGLIAFDVIDLPISVILIDRRCLILCLRCRLYSPFDSCSCCHQI